jgi:isochorismate synthase
MMISLPETNRSYALCSMPSASSEPRLVEYFHADENGILLDEVGNKFVIHPSELSDFLSPQTEISKERHIANVEKAVAEIKTGGLQKVIISRVKFVRRDFKQLSELFSALLTAYPKAMVYLINHEVYGCWMGATPELLLEKREKIYRTVSLAGTLPTADNMIWDQKLFDEQLIVTDFIKAKVATIVDGDIQVQGPETYNAGPVSHLCSRIEFKSDVDADEVAKLLHPTPAICGLPRDTAHQFIRNTETHQRRLYTGYLGIQRINGDVTFYVNLRCMQIFEDHFELHVGGGITADSKANDEWQETENKALVLLNVMS